MYPLRSRNSHQRARSAARHVCFDLCGVRGARHSCACGSGALATRAGNWRQRTGGHSKQRWVHLERCKPRQGGAHQSRQMCVALAFCAAVSLRPKRGGDGRAFRRFTFTSSAAFPRI